LNIYIAGTFIVVGIINYFSSLEYSKVHTTLEAPGTKCGAFSTIL
jgi:hypothetical protein